MGDVKLENFPNESLEVLESLAPPSRISMTSRDGSNNRDFIDSAVDWLRDNEPYFDEIEDETVKEFTSMTGVRMPPKSTRESKKTMKDAVEWLRNNDQDFDDVGDRTVGVFTSVTGVSKPEQLTRKTKKKAMADAVEWLRSNDPNVDDVDIDTLQAFTDMTGVSTPDVLTSKKKRKKIRDVTEWLRNNDVEGDVGDEVVEVLEDLIGKSKISRRQRTGTRPKEKRRREENAESAIEWLRNNEAIVDGMDDEAVKVLTSMTGVSMPLKRT